MLLDHSTITETPTPTVARSNIRVYERLACERPTNCRPASLMSMKEPGWASTICDISRSGVRLHLRRRFEKGTPLAIELPACQEQDVAVVFVKVVHTIAQENGSWVMGCQFVSELSDEELQRVLATPTTPKVEIRKAEPAAREVGGDGSSERSLKERPMNQFLSNVHLRIEIEGGSQIQCVFRRISSCGPMFPGKIIRISGPGRDGDRWSLNLELTRCIEEPSCWKMQARLLSKPSLSNLFRALTAS